MTDFNRTILDILRGKEDPLYWVAAGWMARRHAKFTNEWTHLSIHAIVIAEIISDRMSEVIDLASQEDELMLETVKILEEFASDPDATSARLTEEYNPAPEDAARRMLEHTEKLRNDAFSQGAAMARIQHLGPESILSWVAADGARGLISVWPQEKMAFIDITKGGVTGLEAHVFYFDFLRTNFTNGKLFLS